MENVENGPQNASPDAVIWILLSDVESRNWWEIVGIFVEAIGTVSDILVGFDFISDFDKQLDGMWM